MQINTEKTDKPYTMSDDLKKVKECISLRDRTLTKQMTFRSMWQSIADMMFPQTYGINTKHAIGDELMTHLFDTTALEELENMASGIANNLFPAGQQFFKFKAPLGLADDPVVTEYLYYLTESLHEEIFNSNYVTQTGNTIQYWAGFGTGANYSDWSVKDGLNFRDYAIGTYQCLENSAGEIDTIVLTMPMTARQIQQEYGKDGKNLGQTVNNALSQNSTSQFDEINIIHVIQPRKGRNESKIDKKNMPWESCVVNEKDQILLDEGGFDEFPFAIPRYTVMYREVYGRGRGTMMLPQVRVLNRLAKDYQEMSNKWVNPPKEVLDSFEGEVDVSPGALNYVQVANSIKAIEMGSAGAYPVTKDILEYYRNGVKEGFYKNAFEPISNLTGDRRNTTEIMERLREGLKKATRPFSRLFTELVTPQITRAALLLIRNGVVEGPPEQLQGKNMQLRFINPLALALEDQQSKGGQYWVEALGGVSELFPGVTDNINSDQWARDLGESLGVKSTHIKPIDERDEEREMRAAQQQAMQQMEMAQAGAEAYGKTTKAPEEGSAAEQMGQ